MTTATIDLYNPDTYLDGPPHEVFTELRRTQPVYWQDIPGQRGYWAVLKHADVERVARDPRLFSSAAGGVVLDDLDEPRLEQMRGMLLAMDPPRHRDYRRPLVHRLTPRQVSRLEDGVRRICRDIFVGAAERGEVDFVRDVASHLPTMVVGELMGLPREDWEGVHALAEQITHGQDPDFTGGASAAEATRDMGGYAYGFAVARRGEPPRDDLTSVLLASDYGGHGMTDAEFASLFIQLVTAGQDTTQTMLSSGLLALLDHPDQLAALRADLSLVPDAVEEIVRWANPLHYFRRTATADTELRGVPIRTGDKVAMYYTSANRDEDVFDDGERFDIRRHPNRHLSFGLAEHFCIGVHLARLEGRVFLEELLTTFGSIELTGTPKRLRSNLNNALTSLPVRLAR